MLSLTRTGKWFPAAGNMALNWLAPLWGSSEVLSSSRSFCVHASSLWMAPCSCGLPLTHQSRVSQVWGHVMVGVLRDENAVKAGSISHGDINITSAVWTTCYVELFSHPSHQPRTSKTCCSFKQSAISPLSLFNTTELYLFSLATFSGPICIICILSLLLSNFFFLLLHSAHFSRTPFPSWSQATKYSDWWRQLCFITNCKRSRGAADERREDLWFVRQLNPC